MLYPVCTSICAKASFSEILLFSNVYFYSLFNATVVKEYKVKNFFIDGKYFDFDNKHKVYSNKNIVIEYHTLERIAFTYSSKTFFGKDY